LERKQERLDALERQIGRVKGRIDRLEQVSNQLSWVRVSIFFVGLALTVLAFFFVKWWALIIAAVMLIIFNIVAYYQRRIDRSIVRHKVWVQVQSMQIARIELNWERIPRIPTKEPEDEHPFAIDLDITGEHSLHQLLNVATSRGGSQRLQDWLLNTHPDLESIRKRQALVQELAAMPLFRDRLQVKSLIAAKHVAEQWEGRRLLSWLEQELPSPWLRPLLFVATGLMVVNIVLFLLAFLAGFPQYWILSLLATVVLLFATRKERGDLFEDTNFLRYAFAQLSGVFAYLETYRYGPHALVKQLCKPFFEDRQSRPSLLLERISRLSSAATLERNGLLWLIVNALVPWDFYIADRLAQYKKRLAERLPVWLDTWFELEALNSLANFAYLNPEYSMPEIIPATESGKIPFRVQSMGHPLIPAAKKVVNDFELDRMGEIALITGSNMSGKSTFLRTIGVNLCLAYAGGPVDASSFQTRLFKLFTSMRVNDSVTEGYSYFYAEVRRLKALLTALDESDLPLFFLIDEIFRGTNNRERRIGSESYIRALAGRNCLGVISTHDLELVKLADTQPEIVNEHFREDVLDGHMVFDYILRPGPSPTTNALKIMQMEGLPVQLPPEPD
jgi:ABC-type multidrug transport system fused ATPase/permease subunit